MRKIIEILPVFSVIVILGYFCHWFASTHDVDVLDVLMTMPSGRFSEHMSPANNSISNIPPRKGQFQWEYISVRDDDSYIGAMEAAKQQFERDGFRVIDVINNNAKHFNLTFWIVKITHDDPDMPIRPAEIWVKIGEDHMPQLEKCAQIRKSQIVEIERTEKIFQDFRMFKVIFVDKN